MHNQEVRYIPQKISKGIFYTLGFINYKYLWSMTSKIFWNFAQIVCKKVRKWNVFYQYPSEMPAKCLGLFGPHKGWIGWTVWLNTQKEADGNHLFSFFPHTIGANFQKIRNFKRYSKFLQPNNSLIFINSFYNWTDSLVIKISFDYIQLEYLKKPKFFWRCFPETP